MKSGLLRVAFGSLALLVAIGVINNLTQGRSRGRPLTLPGKIVFQTDRERVEFADGSYQATMLLENGRMRAITAGVFPRLTRDGQKVMYKREHTLYLLDLVTHQTQALEWTAKYSSLYNFDLSPDQQWLAFTTSDVLHSKYPYPPFNLLVARIDGSDVRQLTDAGLAIGCPRWSPDGSLILFHWPKDSKHDDGGGFYVIHPDGTGLRQVVGGSGLEAQGAEAGWSPDGTRIVFNMDLPKEDGWNPMELFLVSPDGSGLKQITHDKWWKRHPTFSPDGQQILYRSPRRGDAIQGSVLYVINADGTNERQVTPDQRIKKYGRWRWATDQNPDWGP